MNKNYCDLCDSFWCVDLDGEVQHYTSQLTPTAAPKMCPDCLYDLEHGGLQQCPLTTKPV